MGERKRKLIVEIAARTPMEKISRRYGMAIPEVKEFIERNGSKIVRAILCNANT